MEQIDNGGQAFPSRQEEDGVHNSNGMSLRDYFAAHAAEADIQAVFSLMNLSAESSGRVIRRWEARYFHADKMLAARRIATTNGDTK